MWFIIAVISNNYYAKPHQRRECSLTTFFSRICCVSISQKKKKINKAVMFWHITMQNVLFFLFFKMRMF